ncbi:MAG TPA: dihydrodipicolinate synthase family protein [Firmicutes bacterium]|nr:dihydrodipicolinate synthase family protein [Bacillota bacterium]
MRPAELRAKIKGVINIMPTPFNADGSLDKEGLRKNARFLVERFRGEDAVIVTTGSTSEFYAMSDEECKTVARIVVEEVNHELPVIVGSARAGTEPTIEMSKYAQEIGADGVMIVLPYYHIPSREGLYRHYKRIAESIDIGIMIYDNPFTSKLWIDPDLMQKLSKIDNIIACKENTTDMGQFYSMLKKVSPEDMIIVTGLSELYYSFLWIWGCRGFISSTISNFSPELALNVYKAGAAGDIKKLRESVDRLMPFNELMAKIGKRRGPLPTILSPATTPVEHPIYIALTKQAMNLVGLAGGYPRDPMDRLTEEEVDELKVALKEMGLAS